MLTIGIDVGGTKVAAGVVDERGQVLARTRRPTPSDSPEETEDTIAEVVAELRASYDVAAVGIGAAGWVDASQSVVLFAPNLAWRGEPLRDEVAARIGLPVTVDNDGNAMAWAEHRFGAGVGEDHLVCVTVGTGIGGGVVLGGALFRGRFGIAPEFGHVRVVPDGRRCGCGNRGCWEQYCSGRALAREAQELGAASLGALPVLRRLVGDRLDDITGQAVTEAALAGDPGAVECFCVMGTWLGQGLADLACVFDPGRFVIGGGVSEAGELLLGPAREAFAARLSGRGHRPLASIRRATMGNEAGLVGAADLARTPTATALGRQAV